MYRIKDCLQYAHKQFNYSATLEGMREELNDYMCDDDSNITDASVLTKLTNDLDDLLFDFQQIKFSSVSYKHNPC